jgi:dienelactone hydrolase
MYARVADASFIIDQLSNATAMAELLPHRGLKPFPTDRIAMLGHSLGGAAAVLAAAQEPRIRGAINWDGTLFGSLPPSGISKPIMFMAGANHSDPSWITAWPHLEGPKLWVEVGDTMHQTFSDVPTLLEAAGQNSPAFEGLLGTIAPAELVRIVVAYTKAWMNGVFEGEEARFEEVEVVRKGNF